MKCLRISTSAIGPLFHLKLLNIPHHHLQILDGGGEVREARENLIFEAQLRIGDRKLLSLGGGVRREIDGIENVVHGLTIFTALLPFSFPVVVTTYTLNQATDPEAGSPNTVSSVRIPGATVVTACSSSAL